MTAGIGTAARRSQVGLLARVAGLGTIFGKTVRDSRRAALLVGVLAGVFMIVAAGAMAVEFATAEARRILVQQMALLPVALRGLLGEPIAIDTLGGFLSWRIGNILPVMLGIWSVVALSGTLAGEAARGSLDLLAATPTSRRRIALEKALGHVAALAAAMVLAAVLTWLSGLAFRTLPIDDIALSSTLGHYLLTGLLILGGGAVAFAFAPVVGRGLAAGFGLAAMFGGYVINAYAGLSSIVEALRPLSWFAWTAGHRPLAGQSDWLAVGLLAAACAAFLAIGVVAFERRDIGFTVGGGRSILPSLPVGIGGPFRRQLADRIGIALAWGAGIGLYAAIIAASAEEFAAAIGAIPGMEDLVRRIYPDVDITQASGVLQLTFFTFGSLMAGIAAATFLAAWASDEERRRLEVVLSTPLSRIRWALSSGAAVLVAIGLMVAALAAIVAVVTAGLGYDVVTPVLGMVVVALYAGAFAGVGLAVGGLVRVGLAAPVAGALVIATFVLDLLGNALNLPDVIVDLALIRHLGQPMAGVFDPVGIFACAVLLVGGVIVGAWGLARRDLHG